MTGSLVFLDAVSHGQAEIVVLDTSRSGVRARYTYTCWICFPSYDAVNGCCGIGGLSWDASWRSTAKKKPLLGELTTWP